MVQEIIEKNWKEYLKELSTKNQVLLIYSPTTIKLMKDCIIPSKVFSIHSHVSYESLNTMNFSSVDVVIGLGGGTAIDKAKYVANKRNIRCVAIPSMLSTNVFATNKVAYIDESNQKFTIDSKLPETVVLDLELLEHSGKSSIYGLTDALSILTALRDWNIADADGVEPIVDSYYVRASRILEQTKNIIYNREFNSVDIFKILTEAGYITNDYGSGRPESASEHILAKIVESKISVPHAVAVAFSMLIVSQFHGCFDEVAGLIRRLGVFYEVAKIPPQILRESIMELRPRPDRYTIVNRLCTQNISQKNIDKYLIRMYEGFDMCYKSIIFDLDGVLWDSTEEITAVYQKHLKNTNLVWSDLMGKTKEQIAAELSISLKELDQIQLEEVLHLRKHAGKIYSEVINTLDALREQGVKLFIVSNCQRGYIEAFLDAFELREDFVEYLCEDDSSSTDDPKADNLERLICQYRMIDPVYVGDTEGDRNSAEKNYMRFIAADYGFGKISEEVTSRIDSFGDILEEI